MESVDSRWIAVSGLGRALERLVGAVDILTPLGLRTVESLDALATWPAREERNRLHPLRRLPRVLRVALGDARAVIEARNRRELAEAVADRPYSVVLQLHRRFQDIGLRIARAKGVPFVLRVEAIEVREEAAWGVHRPVWGGLVERYGETRLMRRSDLVLPVSRVLDEQLASIGIATNRRAVIPNGVDLAFFRSERSTLSLRESHDLESRFVVGWIGGFRPFHGLELMEAIASSIQRRIPRAVLCLVGAGPLRAPLERRLSRFGQVVRFIGSVPHSEIPAWIRSFNVCLALGEAGPYHYSPLKVLEYMACGRPIVASDVGDVRATLDGGRAGVLVPAGDADSVTRAVRTLSANPQFAHRLGAVAYEVVERTGTWDVRARQILDVLDDQRGMVSLLEASSASRNARSVDQRRQRH